ncbi:protein toll [Caerostris extrusa]|uniref:Protein toll n=1 Tax=Caerostris extrusa TaxID=172846 RepID=A0AAV4MAN5_CAEEX|nr:protein toll [Caerostris extrusa]
MNEARCGPDMPNNPGLAERAILMLPDREPLPDNTGLYISKGFELSKDIDRDKEFDAFSSPSASKIKIPVIQGANRGSNSFFSLGDRRKDEDIRLCLHYKHFLPGEFIERNIMRAGVSENSPRALGIFLKAVVLSEFNAAHAQALERSSSHIIVIKLPDLPKDDELPKEIQLYLNSTTYTSLGGEKHFWEQVAGTHTPEVAVRLETRIQRRCQTSNPHERFLRLKASFHISECVHSHTPH